MYNSIKVLLSFYSFLLFYIVDFTGKSMDIYYCGDDEYYPVFCNQSFRRSRITHIFQFRKFLFFHGHDENHIYYVV